MPGIRLRHPRILVTVPRDGASGEFDVDTPMRVPGEMASRFTSPEMSVLGRRIVVGPRHRDIVPNEDNG